MKKIRILIVDDSIVCRRLLSDVLSKELDLEIVGTANNGRVALEKVAQLQPDIVILDVEMPEMDGIQALAEIRKTHSRSHLPVIMCSPLTRQGERTTLESLFKGANDYIHKPATTGGLDESTRILHAELLPKIRALVSVAGAPRQAPFKPTP